MAGCSPLCLAGWWSVDWFWQRDWQNVGLLLVGGWLGVFFTAKFRLKTDRFFFWQLTDYMAGGSPLCLAGRWSVDWFWQRDWQNVGWLLVGGWLGVFLLQNSAYKTDGFFLAVDWLHCWRLPSLLSWSVDWFWQRDWQNLGWLLVGGWLSVLLLQNSDHKTDGIFFSSWLTTWLAAPLFA